MSDVFLQQLGTFTYREICKKILSKNRSMISEVKISLKI